jgi:hypothetical protein
MTKKAADKQYELQRIKDERSKQFGLPSPLYGPAKPSQKEKKDEE